MPSRRLPLSLVSWALLALAAPCAFAGTATGVFNVRITLNTVAQKGICVNEALSRASNAVVRVLCSSGQFVSIAPAPGQPFGGSNGAAWRFSFASASAAPGWAGLPPGRVSGPGTITAYSVEKAGGTDSPVEMLVTF